MNVSHICADLIAIRTENPPGRTDEVIEYIRTFLERLGISSSVSGNAQGMSNLVTTGTDVRLLLCGHVDVVPAQGDGWMYPPFEGVIKDGFVHGRGATDMKGGCASLLSACEDMVNQEPVLPATLAFVCDEETGGENGIRRLLEEELLIPCDCLIAEPTPARHPSIGQKGLCRLEMKFSGVPAHGSLYPAVGVSAIMEALSLLNYVKDQHTQQYAVDESLQDIIEMSSAVLGREFTLPGVGEILKKLTFNPGLIRGGEKSNVVAQYCDLDLELRIPWGCSVQDLLSKIRSHAKNCTIISQTIHDPSITDPLCPLVSITCEEVEKVYGGTVFPIVQWAASDARHLRKAGFRVIEYGPGEISSLHAVNERISIRALEKTSLVYKGIMSRYREPEEHKS